MCWDSRRNYHCFGRESLFDDIVRVLGATNVCSEHGLGPSERVDPEQIAGWNPDWIVVGTGGRTEREALESVAGDQAVRLTAAGRSGQLLAIDDRYLLAMSHHILEAMSAIADALHPEDSHVSAAPGGRD